MVLFLEMGMLPSLLYLRPGVVIEVDDQGMDW